MGGFAGQVPPQTLIMTFQQAKDFFERFWKLIGLGIFFIGAAIRFDVVVNWLREEVSEDLILDRAGKAQLSVNWGWFFSVALLLLIVFVVMSIDLIIPSVPRTVSSVAWPGGPATESGLLAVFES